MADINSIIDELINKDGQILRTSKVMDAGISKDQFYSYIRKEDMVKLAHGIYVKEDAWIDEMYLLQLRFPKIVYSMETALYLHGLAEKEPTPLTVTVPAKYNTRELIESDVNINYVKKEWFDIGVCMIESNDGNMLRVYDKERTICDIIRKKDYMDVAVFNHAITQYMKSKDKNLTRLIQYAQEFHIEKKLRMIMGVLF
ncbi:MAG: type IV toxin-antitoxin system AbiEi family antitoxin domain-containing protein [Erysipelotrichaceae bacterium]|nr:type IV toxin-antitoxin system AbiEi family antitoxin domain-containing protein [Erysipelotrichaceae bacterium]